MSIQAQMRAAVIALSPVQSTVQITKELNMAGYSKIDRVDFQEGLLESIKNDKPKIIVLSSELPGREQTSELLKKISEWSPESKVIFVAKNVDNASIVNTFLSKNLSALLLSERADRTMSFAIEAAEAGQLFMDVEANQVLRNVIKEKQSLLVEKHSDYGYLELLTEREAEVLKYLAEGFNYKSVAKKLFISESTVKTHINNIFTKLQVNDRTQAVLYALKHDLDSLMRETMLTTSK